MIERMKNDQAGFTLVEFIVSLVIAAVVATMVYTFFGSALTQSGAPLARLQQGSNLYKVMENIVADYSRLHAVNLRYKWMPSAPYRVGAIVTPTVSNGHYYKCTTAGTSGALEPTWPASGTVTDSGATWTESGNYVWQASHAYGLNDVVAPFINTGHYYRCTTAGASGTTAPTWPTANNGTVTDGGITWREVGTILARSDAAASNNEALLNDNIGNYLANSPSRYGTGYAVIDNVFIAFDNNTPRQETTTVTENNILKVTVKNSTSAETLTDLLSIR